MTTDHDITISYKLSAITINIPETETDLQALERLAASLNESIGDWLTAERDQQRHCPRCDVNHRLYERHDLERCPYCNGKIMVAKPQEPKFKPKTIKRGLQSKRERTQSNYISPSDQALKHPVQ